MATPALMEVDNDENVVDIINCVAVLRKRCCHWECVSSERKIKSSCFKASEDLESRKRNSQVSRPEFKSSREQKRGLSFNDLNILVYTVTWNINGLCALRYGRQRVATLDGEPNFLLERVSAFGRPIQFNNGFMFS